MSPKALPALLAASMLVASCRSARPVRIPVTTAPRLAGAASYAALEVGAIEVARIKDLDVGDEIRRYLESELRSRTTLDVRLGALPREEASAAAGVEVGPDAGGIGATSPGPRSLVLAGGGRLEETTLATLGGSSIEESERTGLEPLPAPRRARWAHGYRLALSLELRDPVSGSILWSEAFSRELPPRERGDALHALYELLEPVADALVLALRGRKEEERRQLLTP